MERLSMDNHMYDIAGLSIVVCVVNILKFLSRDNASRASRCVGRYSVRFSHYRAVTQHRLDCARRADGSFGSQEI
jgi:hypothetical protein